MKWGLQDFVKHKDAWRNPKLLNPVPWIVRRNLGLAVAHLGEALSARSDSPAEFMRKWEEAEHWLKKAFEQLPEAPESPELEP